MNALSKSVSTLPKKPNQKYLYQRLRESLEFLRGFFNAGGEGLTDEQLKTEQYKVSTPGFSAMQNRASMWLQINLYMSHNYLLKGEGKCVFCMPFGA